MKATRLHHIKTLIAVLLALATHTAQAASTDARLMNEQGHPVLFITSYTPDDALNLSHINDFLTEFDQMGFGDNTIIESLNCKNFSESAQWSQRMVSILSKYQGEQEPLITILLGQEAWATYFSLPDANKPKAPVLMALGSDNLIELPSANDDPRTWMPTSRNFSNELQNRNINVCAGFMYQYAVDETIEMIRKLYPDTEHLAFLSDNTYGGVTLQALVRKVVGEQYPQFDLILIDGRRHTIRSTTERLRRLPSNTTLLIGTWKIDANDSYFTNKATHVMMEAVPTLPVFTLTSVGLDCWAIGGVVPQYSNIGIEIAHKAAALIEKPYAARDLYATIPSHTVVNKQAVSRLKTDLNPLTTRYTLIDNEPSFLDEHPSEVILTIVFLIVIALLCFVIYHRYRRQMRHMKLQVEHVQLLNKRSIGSPTPHNIINLYTQTVAKEEIRDTELRKQFIEQMVENTEPVVQHLQDTTDIVRLNLDILQIDSALSNIVDTCMRLVNEYNAQTHNGNTFHLECGEDSISILTDIKRFEQVMRCLLANAERFTHNGTVNVDIERLGPQVQISVTDNGCGLPDDKRGGLIDQDNLAHTNDDNNVDIALHLSRLIIKRLGGQLWFDELYRNGSCVIVTLPIYQS